MATYTPHEAGGLGGGHCPPFGGSTVLPDDPRYQTLIRGFNQRWVGDPQRVVVCGTVDQVVAAVQLALDERLRITARGGGHCYEGFVSCNDGVILDLSPLNCVFRDPESSLYCVEGGCTLWDVYNRLYRAYGVTLPGGSCYSVGAGGHVTGGGYGLLSRLHGLVVDYLAAVEMVVVDGERRARVVTVDHDDPDTARRELLWANQGGGGGNFGIVTKFWFRTPPAAPEDATLLTLAWDWDGLVKSEFAAIIDAYGSFLAAHSDPDSEFSSLFALLHVNQRANGQISLTCQDVDPSGDAIGRFRDAMLAATPPHVPHRTQSGYHTYVAPTADLRRMPWLEATQTLNGVGPNQRGKYKSAYMKEPFPAGQIDTMWDFLGSTEYQNPQALLQVDSYGCAINATPSGATAVPQRSSIMKLQYQTYWQHEAHDDVNLAWIRAFYDEMYGPRGPWPDDTFDGCYVNYPDVDLDDWQYLYYKEAYERLRHVKAAWDPLNVFHHAQSVELPASPG